MKLTKNFDSNELKCPCCNDCKMDPLFMQELQKIRKEYNIPMAVTSGYRCKTHNDFVSSNSKGDHARGLAVDISITSRYFRANLLKLLLQSEYFRDIAIDKTFIHIGKGKEHQGIGVY